MRKNLIILAFIFFIFFINIGNYSLAQNKPELREPDGDSLDLDKNILNQGKDYVYKAKDVAEKAKKYKNTEDVPEVPVLKGGISELKAFVGKSQILRFDEPIKRISITKPDLVDMIFLSPKEVIMNGLTGGESTFIIWFDSSEDPVFYNLFVENTNFNFLKEVEKIAPNEKEMKVNFANTGGSSGLKVMLSGKISSSIIRQKIQDIAKVYGYEVTDLSETLTPQVMLEIKVVEMGKTKNKSRGFDYNKDFGLISGMIDYIENNANFKFDNEDKPAVLNTILAYQKISGQFKFGGNGVDSFFTLPSQNLVVQLKAAESEGLVKILAEPKIMVTNKETANFNSGSRVPIPSGVDQLGNVKVTYEQVGITINLTPEILEDSQRILLKVTAEVSEIDKASSTSTNGFSTYGFVTRKSDTKVELQNDETMVIAGMIRKNTRTARTKTPFLSNLPIIGKLLDSVTNENDETELMIFVTPQIVRPAVATGG
jgi:pilus assembly protein CpaC